MNNTQETKQKLKQEISKETSQSPNKTKNGLSGIRIKALIASLVTLTVLGGTVLTVSIISTNNNSETSNNPSANSSNSGKKGNISEKVKVGDFVNYVANPENSYTVRKDVHQMSYDLVFAPKGDEKWRVLSILDDGSVELVADSGFEAKDGNLFWLIGPYAYLYGAEELNNASAAYATGKHAKSGRSYNLTDFIKAIGFDRFDKMYNLGLSGMSSENEKIEAVKKLMAKESYSGGKNNGQNYTISNPKNTFKPDIEGDDGFTQVSPELSGVSNFIGYFKIKNELVSGNNTDELSLIVGSKEGGYLLPDQYEDFTSDDPDVARAYFGFINLKSSLDFGGASGIVNCIATYSDKKNPSGNVCGAMLRPVITLEANTNISSGDGTKNSPFELD